MSAGGVLGRGPLPLTSATYPGSKKGRNCFPSPFRVLPPEGSDADLLSQRQGAPIYENLPPLTLNRLVREAVSGFYLRKI